MKLDCVFEEKISPVPAESYSTCDAVRLQTRAQRVVGRCEGGDVGQVKDLRAAVSERHGKDVRVTRCSTVGRDTGKIGRGQSVVVDVEVR